MKKLVVGCLLVSVLVLGACQKSATKTTVASTGEVSSTVASTSSTSEEKKSTLSSSSAKESISSATFESAVSSSSELPASTIASSQPDNLALAQQQLVGKSFSLAPVLFDGQAVNQAMDENKAPQNLVHDGGAYISFTSDSTAFVELAGSYRPNYEDEYTMTNETITVANQTIPYSITNGVLTFDSWTTELDGHTITWAFE